MNSKETLRLPDRKSICVEKRGERTNVLVFKEKNTTMVKLNKPHINRFLKCKNRGDDVLELSGNMYLQIKDLRELDKVRLVVFTKLEHKDKTYVDFELSRKDFRKLCRIVKEVFEYGE